MQSNASDASQLLHLSALTQALQETGTAVLHLTVNGVFDLAENLPNAWTGSNLLGRPPQDALPRSIQGPFIEALEQSRQFGAERIFEVEFPIDSQNHIFQAKLRPDETGFLVLISDVTANRRQDAAMHLLIREVSHRSKNLLAIVQSVAVQTARHSENIEQFLEKFRGRLYALSSTQDLVTDSDWHGTPFRTLLTSQFARLGLDIHTKTTVSGVDPVLSPNAALHVGLALHELGTNARLYGALAPAAAGHVTIDTRMEDQAGSPAQFIIEWHETGPSSDPSQSTPGFGSLVLERIVPLSVGGSAELTRGEAQLDYRLTIPADQLVS
jgi:two-component sensor histidine kinase